MKKDNLKIYAKYFSQIILAVAGLLILIDFTISRHAYFHLEEIILLEKLCILHFYITPLITE